MAFARKKVVVRMLEGGVLAGYLPGSGLLDSAGALSLLDLEGRIVEVALGEVKWIAYVRDFNLGEADPERLSRKTFLARPRGEGLWLRLTLGRGEVLEGLAAIDLGLADGWVEDRGVYLTPPDMRSNTQRLFVPRTAVVEMQVVAVITTPTKSAAAKKPGREGQETLFE